MPEKLTLEEIAPADAADKERDAKVALLRRVQQDRARLRAHHGRDVADKDTGKVYIWCHPDLITHFEGMGYQIVKTPHGKAAGGNSKAMTKWHMQDMTHRHGDGILMHVDLEIYDAIKTLEAAEALEHDRSSPAGFSPALQQFARESGVPITISQEQRD